MSSIDELKQEQLFQEGIKQSTAEDGNSEQSKDTSSSLGPKATRSYDPADTVSDDEDEDSNPAYDLRASDDIIVNEQGQRVFRFWNGDVTKTIIKEGKGRRPVPGAKVTCHYVGTLDDGSKFDSSRDRDTPFTFNVGQRQVIQAWDAAIMTMVPEEVAIIKTTSQYAYGDLGAPNIPEKASLTFEVEMLGWEPVTKNIATGVDKCLLKRGPGWRQVVFGTKLSIRIQGKWFDAEDNEHMFLDIGKDQEPVPVDLDDPQLPPGLEIALLSMNPGEISQFWIAHNLAGNGFLPDRQVPGQFRVERPDQKFEYEITIVSAELPKETWEMEKQEKLDFGTKLRLAGNGFFTSGALTRALARYNAVLDLFEYETDLEGQLKQDADALVLACRLNKATVQVKMKQYKEAIVTCNDAIRTNPNSVKAWYKRAEAEAYLDELEEAKRSLEHALTIPGQSENPDVKRLLHVVEERITLTAKREKKLWQAAAKRAGILSTGNEGATASQSN